jgi:hypothetical protein
MDDATSYIKPLFILKSQILPGIYPAIFLLHLYPELRERALQEALKPCRMKAKQLRDTQDEVKGKVIESMS